MSKCSIKKEGNLYETRVPENGPFKAHVEKNCRDDNEFSVHSSTYESNVKPSDPVALRKQLEQATLQENGQQNGQPGILQGIFNSVFRGPQRNNRIRSAEEPSKTMQVRKEREPLEEQRWPLPTFENDDGNNDDEFFGKHVHTTSREIDGGRKKRVSTKKHPHVRKTSTKNANVKKPMSTKKKSSHMVRKSAKKVSIKKPMRKSLKK